MVWVSRWEAAKAAGIIFAATVVSKVLGFGREAALAAGFGASAAMDAYLVAQVVPMMLLGLVGAALTTAAIPVFTAYGTAEKKGELSCVIWSVFHAVLLVLSALTLMGIFVSPLIIRLVAPGFSPAQAELAAGLSRIIMPTMLILGLSGWATAVLQARKSFFAPAIIGIPSNICLIIFALWAARHGGIYTLAWLTVLATSTQLLVQVPALLKQEFRYQPVLNLAHPAVRRIAVLMTPAILGVAIGQINTVVDRILASGLAEGSITALNYANRVAMLPIGFLITPILTVFYPSLAARWTAGERERFRELVEEGLTICLLLLVPVTVGLVLLRIDIVRFIFERGAFDARATQATAVAALCYGLGLLPIAWRDHLSRAFYALQDTTTPMLTGFVSITANVVLNLILVRYLAHAGLALATALANSLGCLLLLFLLRRRLGGLGGKKLAGSALQILVGSLVMAVVVTFLQRLFPWPAPGYVRVASVLPLPPGLVIFVAQALRLILFIGAGALTYALVIGRQLRPYLKEYRRRQAALGARH
jgi:putative peptidoglycan lipid II flippase